MTAGRDPARAELRRRILSLVGGEADPGGFEPLALDLFRFQYGKNAIYRAFCDRQGRTPREVAAWDAIPAVPAEAFKAAPMVCGDPEGADIVFRTSGTAGRRGRGEHRLRELGLYHAAILAGFGPHLLPDRDRIRIVSLVPPVTAAPDSSLAHMVEAITAALGAEGSACVIGPDGVSIEAFLRGVEDVGEPVCLLATAFALVHLLDGLGEASTSLPAGSRLMVTGGFKGRSREVSPDELLARVEDRLGIPAAWCVSEYGMTELASQFYDGIAGDAPPPSRRVFRPPPWVRSRVMDPDTLEPVPEGEPGLLRHLDLANLDSVAAVQTEDVGVTGEGGFRLLGRGPAAEPRGCSLAMEEIMEALAAGGDAPPSATLSDRGRTR